MNNGTTAQTYPRDLGFLGRANHLICRDCGGAGHDDEEGGSCEKCDGTGGVICMCCPAEETRELAVTVCIERGQREPMCRNCAESWVGLIEEYDTPHELETMAPKISEAA